MTNEKDKNPTYYFIDVDLHSRQLIGWGTERKGAIQQAGSETERVLIQHHESRHGDPANAAGQPPNCPMD